MPNIDKPLEQNNAGFKRYTGIHKATFYEMLEVMQQHDTQKTKSGRPSVLSLSCLVESMTTSISQSSLSMQPKPLLSVQKKPKRLL